MNSFLSDFLYSFRVFFKRPGLTLLAIIALAVSLGMSTTTFSILNGMFFKPLPFKNPEELHNIFLKNTQSALPPMPIPYQRLSTLRQLDSFENVMGYYSGTINVSGHGKPHRYDGAFVSPNFLDVLGHKPILGNSFSPDESKPEVLISYDMWMDRFHGDQAVLGQSLRANGIVHTIIGVLPEGFRFPLDSAIWVRLSPSLYPFKKRNMMSVVPVGRLKPKVSEKAVQSELDACHAAWDSEHSEWEGDLRLSCEPFGRLEMNRASQSALIVTISSVIFILLVSCANVANLLVGRALTRGREMAIRSAVGATRGRILRQLLTESLVLTFMGAVGGLLYAAWAVDASMESNIWNLPYWMSFELDWRVFLFVLMIMLITALVSGLVPAWQASKIDLNEMLKDTAHTSTSFRLGRLTRLLAIIQVAFSCALLFGAGLVTRNVYQMSIVDTGFPRDEIYTMRMGLFQGDYPEEKDRDQFYDQLTNEVIRIPGVKSSAVTSWIGQLGNYPEPFSISGKSDESSSWNYAYFESVSEDYFKTLDLEILDGRNFDKDDTSGSEPVAIVNEAFAKRYFKGENPIGETIQVIKGKLDNRADPASAFKIVGLVPTVRVSNCTKLEEPESIVYTPYTQTDSAFMTLAVRTDNGTPEELRDAIQDSIFKLDPNLPVYFTMTMGEYMDEQIYPYRLLARFFLSIGIMALFLAAIGIYGMLAFNVSRRRREIGIRMALGANTRRIVTQILQQGIIQMVLGIVTGSGLAFIVGTLTRNFLINTNPIDPSVYLGVLLILVGVAALALFIPARRAARLSPLEALRYE